MADVKISDLPAAGAAQDADVTAGVQSGTTVKQSNSALATYMATKLADAGTFLLSANNLSDLNNITTAATNIGLLHGAVTYSDNVDHVLTAPLPAIISIGNTVTANFTLPVPSTINTNTLGNRIFINNYSTASQIFKNSAGTTIFTASPVTNYLLTLIDIGSNTWSASSIVGFVNSMAGDNVNVSLQSAYGVSGSPQIVGDMAFDDGSGTQCLISGSQVELLSTVDQGVDNIFAELQFFGKTPSGNTFAGQFEPGFCKESGGDSGFINLVLLDNNVENRIFYAKGTSSTSGARIGLGNSSGLGTVSNVSINLGYGATPNPNAIFQIETSTQGELGARFNSTQESTFIGLLGTSDDGMSWYNTSLKVPTFWDGTDKQQLLVIDNIIQGSNMSITNNGDGTVTFASSGSSGTSEQVNGSFTVFQNSLTSTTPSTSSFTAVAIDPSKFTATHQNGMSVTPASIDGVTTPIIQNTSTGGTRYCLMTFEITINPSFAAGQVYTFGIAIQRNGGSIVQTNYQMDYAVASITTASSFKPISISGLIDLGTNDFAYLRVISNTASQPFLAYKFNAISTDTTVSSIPLPVASSSGGTGVSNSSTLTWTGGNNLTFTTSAATNVTLPTSGTLVASGDSVTFNGIQDTALVGGPKVIFGDASGILTYTGTVPVSQGGTGTGVPFTAGSVVFAGAGGGYAQDNSNLFWDDTNTRLYLGANSSTTTFQGIGILNLYGTSGSDKNSVSFYTSGTNVPAMQIVPYDHGNNAIYFDAYDVNNVQFSSSSTANFAIKQQSTNLQFLCASGTLPTFQPAWITALQFDTSGNTYIPSLNASQVVITDGSKKLLSLAYTSSNTVSTLVERDSSGNFSAGTITATLNGTATNATNVFINNNITTNSTYYIPFASTLNANDPLYTNANLIFNPNTNKLGTTSGGLTYEGNSFQGITSGNAQCIGLYGGNISFLTTPSATDANHGLGYYGSSYTKSWGGLTNIDGPVLFGFTGVVLGSSNGSVSMLHATKTQINLFDTNGSALSGINPALVFNSVLAAGNYINLGGNGRNIGVKTGGNHFFSYNLDYNTSGSYQYNASSTGCVLELTSGGGLSFLTAPSGTAGNSATTTTQFSVSNTGVINANGLTATGIVTVDGSHNLVSVAAESSYTPTLGDGTNNFSVTVAQGSYYKIGSLYHVQATITWTGKGSAVAGSGLYITLPANVASASSCSATVGYASGMSFTGSCLTSACGASTNFLAFYGISNTGTATQVLVSNAGTAGQIFVSATFWSA